MDLVASEEQRAFADSARGVLAKARERLSPQDATQRTAAIDDSSLWQEAVDSGWLQFAAPDSVRTNFAFAAILFSEAGRAAIAAPLLETISANAVLGFGLEVDPPAPGGSGILALASAGARRPEDLGVLDPGSSTLAGPPASLAVPWAHAADSVLVPVRVAASSGDDLVGLASWPNPTTWRPVPQSSVLDHDLVTVLELPRRDAAIALLSEPVAGDGSPIWDGLAAARLLRSWEMLGGARRALEMTGAHVSTREQFGRTLGSMQAVQQRLADLWIELEAAELLAAEATHLAVGGRGFRASAECATFASGRTAERVTQGAAHLHGGIGYMWEYDLHWHYRRVKALRLRQGTTAQHLRSVAREKLAEVRSTPYPSWPRPMVT